MGVHVAHTSSRHGPARVAGLGSRDVLVLVAANEGWYLGAMVDRALQRARDGSAVAACLTSHAGLSRPNCGLSPYTFPRWRPGLQPRTRRSGC